LRIEQGSREPEMVIAPESNGHSSAAQPSSGQGKRSHITKVVTE
jgi:hypothetical protein